MAGLGQRKRRPEAPWIGDYCSNVRSDAEELLRVLLCVVKFPDTCFDLGRLDGPIEHQLNIASLLKVRPASSVYLCVLVFAEIVRRIVDAQVPENVINRHNELRSIAHCINDPVDIGVACQGQGQAPASDVIQ